MADDPTSEGYWQGNTWVPSVKGSQAGQDAKYSEVARKAKQQEYDNEMGWSGLGGAAKKPREPGYTQQFEAWHQKKYGKPAPGSTAAAPPKTTPTAPAKPISSSTAADALEARGTAKKDDEEDD